MRAWLRRVAGFALVPLSLLPLAAIVPVVAPSVAKRIDVLQGVAGAASAPAPAPASVEGAQASLTPTFLPPLVAPGHDRRHARAATAQRRHTPRHNATRRPR